MNNKRGAVVTKNLGKFFLQKGFLSHDWRDLTDKPLSTLGREPRNTWPKPDFKQVGSFQNGSLF
ncbi:MAG: hypothetical protein Q4E67_05115 [Planctomycetia bacterium]|nr:hypothetical protein [Planctomycetia bacterium]